MRWSALIINAADTANAIASIKNTEPTPDWAIKIPTMAGPINSPAEIDAMIRELVVNTRSDPTISATSAR